MSFIVSVLICMAFLCFLSSKLNPTRTQSHTHTHNFAENKPPCLLSLNIISQMSCDNDLSAHLSGLLTVVKEGFSQYMAAQQAGSPNPIPLQQHLLPLVMGFAGGNWAFLDTIIPHIGKSLTDFVASVGGGDHHAGAKHLGAEVRAKVQSILGGEGGLISVVGALCIAGSDPVSATAANVGLLVEQLITLAIGTFNGATTGLFSENAKRVVVHFSGGWLEQIASLLTAGRSGIMTFLQGFSTIVTPRVVALFPSEISMYTMFAAPLVMNMLMQFHQQYIKEKESEEAGLYA